MSETGGWRDVVLTRPDMAVELWDRLGVALMDTAWLNKLDEDDEQEVERQCSRVNMPSQPTYITIWQVNK